MKTYEKKLESIYCVFSMRIMLLPHQVNAQAKSQKKITIEFSNERLPSVLKRLKRSQDTRSFLRTMTSKVYSFRIRQRQKY